MGQRFPSTDILPHGQDPVQLLRLSIEFEASPLDNDNRPLRAVKQACHFDSRRAGPDNAKIRVEIAREPAVGRGDHKSTVTGPFRGAKP